MSEQDITRSVIDAVNATGIAHVDRSHAGVAKVRGAWIHLGVAGRPDVTGYMRRGGAFVGLEVKKPGEKPSAAQIAYRDDIRKAGGIAAVVTSAHEAVLLLLGEQRKREG